MGGGETGVGEKNGSGVENVAERSFKLEREPKEDVGFVIGKGGIEELVFEVKSTNEPGKRGNKG